MYSSNEHKPVLVRFVAILLVLLIMMGAVLPAGATAPETLNFDFINVTYYDLPSFTGYGTWTANGLFASAGTAVEKPNHAGWDPDGCWRSVHTVDTLTDGASGDTITIRTQVTKILGEPNCVSFSARASWVIVSGTGAYADLHGQGDAEVRGYLEFTDSGTFNYVVTYNLTGNGHFN